MIAIPARGLVFLAQTKCASTSIEEVLDRFAQLAIRNDPGMKHLNYREFTQAVQPLLDRFGYPRQAYEVVGLIREPIDWLHSWWRYRTRPDLADPSHPRHVNYTGDVSFEEFAEAYIAGGHTFAEVGRQADFLIDDAGNIGVDRIFRYEDLDLVLEYLRIKLDAQVPGLDLLNVSPAHALMLSSTARQELERFFQPEYEVHATADGQVRSGLGTMPAVGRLLGPSERIDQARPEASPLVLVVGTGRSVTRTVAGILHDLGACVPEPFVPGDPPSLVSQWLKDFHQVVRDEAHLDLRTPRPDAISTLTKHPAYDRWSDEATRWLLPHAAGDQTVCLHDAGLVWTLPIWARVASALGRRLKVVVAIREPFESLDPQVKPGRGQDASAAATGQAVERWIVGALSAEWASRGFDRVVVAYSTLVERWPEMVEHLGEFGLGMPADRARNAAGSAVSPLSAYGTKGRTAARGWTPLSDLADRIYWELRLLATDTTGGTQNPAHSDALDSLGEAYESFRKSWKLESIRPNQISLPRLSVGDAGPEVARLQALLTVAGFDVEVTGVFSTATAEAIREFKQLRGLGSNSVCGRGCWTALLGVTRDTTTGASDSRQTASVPSEAAAP